MEQERKVDRIALRATPQQVREIDDAAASEHKTRSDFMMEASLREARRVLSDRRVFVLGDAQRNEFMAILDRPPRETPRLRALFERGSVLDDAG